MAPRTCGSAREHEKQVQKDGLHSCQGEILPETNAANCTPPWESFRWWEDALRKPNLVGTQACGHLSLWETLILR